MSGQVISAVQQRRPVLRTGDGMSGDTGGIVIRGPRDQARPKLTKNSTTDFCNFALLMIC
jgi:hypothetical protein